MKAQWHGWIMVVGTANRRGELEAMGIRLGPYDTKLELYTRCLLSDHAMATLLKHRGKFLWKLSRIRTDKNDLRP